MEENRRLIVPNCIERAEKLVSVGVAYVPVFTRHIVSLGKHEIDTSSISSLFADYDCET